jgi:hypothetical protein
MKTLQEDRTGVSVIIGALMLTLIVVTAAASYSIFIAERQKSIQENELYQLQKNQEDIAIINMKPIYNNSDILGNVSFTIGSMHTRDSAITSVSINGHLLKHFNLTRQNNAKEEWDLNLSTGIYELNGTGDDVYYPLEILSYERVTLTVNVSSESQDLLKKVDEEININEPIILEISTSLINTFYQAFIPPTAIILVSTESLWNGTDYEEYIILDGSLSDHPSDGYITQWNWTIKNASSNPLYSWNKIGRKIRAQFNASQSYVDYIITLEVTDNFGMIGRDFLYYYH